MRKIRIADTTLSKAELPFRKKVELVKHLDSLGVSVIETGTVPSDMSESLFVKTAASVIKNSILAVPAGTDAASVQKTWESLKSAAKPRLQVCIPLSTSQMEYILHKKSDAVVPLVRELVSECRKFCADVEFVALDSTRAESGMLTACIDAAAESGASTVTLCDSAGCMLVDEYISFFCPLAERLKSRGVSVAVSCSDSMGLAAACSVAALCGGADEVKVCCNGGCAAYLGRIADIVFKKGEAMGVSTGVGATEINSILACIGGLLEKNAASSPFENRIVKRNSDIAFTRDDGDDAIEKAVCSLGYELDEDDMAKVCRAFRKIAERKACVSTDELEAIIASEAMQVAQTYSLDSYVVTCSNATDILAHVKLKRNGEVYDGLSIGDGPIDAAFLAIEKITGCHYELDDFRIQAITQEREAMGQTFVRLRSEGKVYSGSGISTDIVGSGILAYLSALNKIAAEDNE